MNIVQSILDGRVAVVLQRAETPTIVVREVMDLARTAMEHHLERRIRASALFKAPQAG